MLCLSDSIRDDDPSLQQGLQAASHAPHLTALLMQAWALARMIAVHVVESVLREWACRPTRWPPCPACGKVLPSKGFATREVTSLLGVMKWRRRIGRCPEGGEIGQVVPFDEALGLVPSQRSSWELQYLGTSLAVCVPYATAAELLSWYSAGSISARAVWRWAQEAGGRAISRLERALAALERGEKPQAARLEDGLDAAPLALSADGVMVPFRPHNRDGTGKTKWREIKVGVLARLAQHTTRKGQVITRLYHRRLVAVLGDIDTLKPRFWLEALRQGIRQAPQVVWLRDGGRGFWGLYDSWLSAHARGILDFYHAAQTLWKGAAAWLDGRTSQARQWLNWARHRLRHHNPDDVLEDLLEALEVESLPQRATEALVKLYDYLTGHRDHIDYAKYEALGLPLGSGMVERACKWLIQQRFKGVGMRWSEAGFNHLVHLRLAWVNGTFDELFQMEASPNR
jgi:hypothetical protein